METIKNRIKKVIVEQIMSDISVSEIDDNVSLLNDLQLDSIQLLQLITSLEEEFQIQFSGDDLVLDIFDNIQSIADLIDTIRLRAES